MTAILLILAAAPLAGCFSQENATRTATQEETPARQGQEAATPGTTSVTFAWTNRPTDDVLKPGDLLAWSMEGAIPTSMEVVLESPSGRASLCTGPFDACWLPPELEANAEHAWWVRAYTSRGIVQSPEFTFRTHGTPFAITLSPPPAGLLPTGGVGVTVQPTPHASLGLLTDAGGLTTVCRGTPLCTTTAPLIAGETYTVEARAYDSEGHFVRKAIRAQANRPPTSPYVSEPNTGTEVAQGDIRLAWAPATDPDGDAVSYTLATRIGAGDWEQRDMGTATTYTLRVAQKAIVTWQVTARDGRGHDVASPFSAFLTAGTAPAAAPTRPTADERAPPLAGVTYEWLPMKQGLHAVEVRALGETMWRTACEGSQQCRDPTPLRASTAYEWRVVREGDYYGTAASPTETFRTADPVVLIHGLLSDGETWSGTVLHLLSEGESVVDFDLARPGVQALSYAPAGPTEGIHATALHTVAPAIERAMRAAGHPEGTSITVMAHSMGGLIARSIVQAEADNAYPIAKLLTLGTPHHGSLMGGVLSVVGPRAIAAACAWVFNVAYRACSVGANLAIDVILGPWKTAVDDLAPWSAYLSDLNGQQARLPYYAVAGTGDLVVSQASATYNAAASLGVALGHAALTGKACTSPEACSVNLLAVNAARSLLK